MSSRAHRHAVYFRSLLVGVLALSTAACGGTSTGGAGKEDGVESVRVGYHPDVHAAGIIAVGQRQKYWDKVGIEVEPKQFSGGPVLIQAMAGGDVDIGYIGPGATWLAASGRAKVITVDSLNVGDYVIGQPEISNLSDLKGKSVGYPEGTSGEMILRLALSKAGLSMDDIKRVPLDPDAVVPAFAAKKIDVAAIWVPLAQEIRNQVPKANVLASNSDFAGQYKFPQMWVVSKKFAKERPETVQKFLQGFILANDFRADNLATAVNATAEFTGVPRAALTAQAETTTWLTSDELAAAYQNGEADQWYEKLQELLVTMGKLDHGVPTEQFADFSLYHKAKRELPS